jgi:S1-C subfamily serine protease
VKSGQAVTAVGNAGGTGTLSVAAGTITALGQAITATDGQGAAERLTGLIETNASLQPGDSGGPLLNSARQVVGMDTAASASFRFRRGGDEGYAIAINRALLIARQIAAGRASAAVHIGATAFLGLSVQASGYYRGDAPGTLVVGVVPASPGDRAGLVPGDVVTSFNGRTVDSPTTLVNLLLRQSPGARVQLGWVDQFGTQQTAIVTLASGPPQ